MLSAEPFRPASIVLDTRSPPAQTMWLRVPKTAGGIQTRNPSSWRPSFAICTFIRSAPSSTSSPGIRLSAAPPSSSAPSISEALSLERSTHSRRKRSVAPFARVGAHRFSQSRCDSHVKSEVAESPDQMWSVPPQRVRNRDPFSPSMTWARCSGIAGLCRGNHAFDGRERRRQRDAEKTSQGTLQRRVSSSVLVRHIYEPRQFLPTEITEMRGTRLPR